VPSWFPGASSAAAGGTRSARHRSATAECGHLHALTDQLVGVAVEVTQQDHRAVELLIDVGGYASFLSFLIKSSFTTW
jgi:hypothetical protein